MYDSVWAFAKVVFVSTRKRAEHAGLTGAEERNLSFYPYQMLAASFNYKYQFFLGQIRKRWEEGKKFRESAPGEGFF
jgi:hypothetical protein